MALYWGGGNWEVKRGGGQGKLVRGGLEEVAEFTLKSSYSNELGRGRGEGGGGSGRRANGDRKNKRRW